jgi:hypothetical protein
MLVSRNEVAADIHPVVEIDLVCVLLVNSERCGKMLPKFTVVFELGFQRRGIIDLDVMAARKDVECSCDVGGETAASLISRSITDPRKNRQEWAQYFDDLLCYRHSSPFLRHIDV